MFLYCDLDIFEDWFKFDVLYVECDIEIILFDWADWIWIELN